MRQWWGDGEDFIAAGLKLITPTRHPEYKRNYKRTFLSPSPQIAGLGDWGRRISSQEEKSIPRARTRRGWKGPNNDTKHFCATVIWLLAGILGVLSCTTALRTICKEHTCAVCERKASWPLTAVRGTPFPSNPPILSEKTERNKDLVWNRRHVILR